MTPEERRLLVAMAEMLWAIANVQAGIRGINFTLLRDALQPVLKQVQEDAERNGDRG